jgi:O-antigen/teichoic acid export membrane protein
MIKRIIKTSFFSIGSRGFLTLTNLAIMYSISHTLGEMKLGIYGISAFLYYLFSFFTSFELITYFGKEIAHKRDRNGEIKTLYGEIVTTFLIGVGISVVTLLFLLLFYHQIDASLMIISAVSGIIFGIEKNLSGILLGKEKMHFEFISQITAFFMVAVPVVLFVRRLDIAGVYFLRIAASVTCIALRGYFTRILKYLERKSISLKKYNWKEISFFSASGLSFFVQHHIDLFILSFIISKELEGAYFLALRIFLAFSLLAEMISFALTPYISRSYRGEDPNRFNRFFTRVFYVQVGLGAAASVILFFGRFFLVEFFTDAGGSGQAADFLLYFSFFIFFRFVSYYTGNILTSTRYQNIRFYILVTSAALLILLEFVLGSIFSVYGVIYARAVVEVLIFTAYLVAIARVRNEPIDANAKI